MKLRRRLVRERQQPRRGGGGGGREDDGGSRAATFATTRAVGFVSGGGGRMQFGRLIVRVEVGCFCCRVRALTAMFALCTLAAKDNGANLTPSRRVRAFFCVDVRRFRRAKRCGAIFDDAS